jgi:hypothetical protein
MAKHEPQTLTLSEIINRIEIHTDQNWCDVMGIDIPGLAEAEANGEQDDWKTVKEIESAYLSEHGGDMYEVHWPQHVAYPKFNGDASYHLTEACEKT